MRPRSRDAMRPGYCANHPRKSEGAGKTGCALHPRSRVQNGQQKRTRAYRFSGGNPAFPAQWFYGLYRALPGDRAFLPPSPLRSSLLKNLTPASGRQDHTALPSASARFVTSRRRVHRIPPRVRDDRDTPLCGVDGGSSKVDLPDGTSGIFFAQGLDRNSLICPSGRSSAYCRGRDPKM
jgi:hypothetical protein